MRDIAHLKALKCLHKILENMLWPSKTKTAPFLRMQHYLSMDNNTRFSAEML